jgi:hypothetical protein
MTDIDPQFVPHKYSPRFYGSASLLVQEGIDGFDDDPEKRLNRKDDERNYADAQWNDDDISEPCYEQDDDYTEDRFPAINENQRRRAN